MDRYYDKFARLTILEIPDKRVFTLFSCAATKKDFADTNILYDNKIVATIKDSGIITLPVADKKMKSDIIISLVNPASPIEISTEAEMTALLTSGEVGGVYKYTGTTGTYENGALYVLEEEGFNITLSGVVGGMGYYTTYLKLNSKPTSAEDYDYDAESLGSSGSVTVKASSIWYWGGYKETPYTEAVERVYTEDITDDFGYGGGGGSN